MMDKKILRQLVLRALTDEPKVQTYGQQLFDRINELAIKLEAFPPEYYPKPDPNSRRHGGDRGPQLQVSDMMLINEIVWDMIVERVITVGMNRGNDQWPWLRVTDLGKAILAGGTSSYYDPDEYVALLQRLIPHVDTVISQYALEGVRSFRQNLLFASAVMFGAASEKAILLLLDAIGTAYIDPAKKKTIAKVIDEGRMPKRFQAIEDAVKLASSSSMPYAVHQGSTQHLISFQEMVRAQRNDAVHPAAGHIDKEKIFLTMQTFPTALESTYRLLDWFASNTI